MTGDLHGKGGNGTGKHRDTGRQRSEPEEENHARQPEGLTGTELENRPQGRPVETNRNRQRLHIQMEPLGASFATYPA